MFAIYSVIWQQLTGQYARFAIGNQTYREICVSVLVLTFCYHVLNDLVRNIKLNSQLIPNERIYASDLGLAP